MNTSFICDYERMIGKKWSITPYNLITVIVRHQIRYMYHFRKYSEHKNIFRRLCMFRLTRKYGLEISPEATIGSGLYLGHPYNITVGSGVVLGENVNLHKGCTIGRVNMGSKQGSPRIGSNVYIGINATVVGNIIIGDDVMICANTFVNFDVPSHSIVINDGCSIHHKDNATDGYIRVYDKTN